VLDAYTQVEIVVEMLWENRFLFQNPSDFQIGKGIGDLLGKLRVIT